MSDSPGGRQPAGALGSGSSIGVEAHRQGRTKARVTAVTNNPSRCAILAGHRNRDSTSDNRRIVAMSESVTGAEFKKQLRAGVPKLGLFLNSHSPTVAEQLAHSGYDWLLVDTQHGPMGNESLSGMLAGIANGGAKSLVRVGGYADRSGIQQSLDMGADGILVPYINSADEARTAVSCCRYPTAGTRSVYFPQRSMNKGGLLGYAGAANDNVIVALQVETADCIKNIDAIAAVPGVDLLFLGQNDLCMSMGLYEKYKFPDMYTSPELGEATSRLIAAARKNKIILGVFLFGTSRVGEFLEKG